MNTAALRRRLLKLPPTPLMSIWETEKLNKASVISALKLFPILQGDGWKVLIHLTLLSAIFLLRPQRQLDVATPPIQGFEYKALEYQHLKNKWYYKNLFTACKPDGRQIMYETSLLFLPDKFTSKRKFFVC